MEKDIFLKSYQWNLTFTVLALLFSSSVTWAKVDSSGYKLSVYGGWQENILNPSSFTLKGNESEQLVPNHSRTDEFTWGLGSAYRFVTPNQQNILRYTHDISIGLDMFYFQARQNGTVIDYNVSPEFNYRINIRSIRFMGNVEWTFLPLTSRLIYPFLEAGVGLASNTNYYADAPNSNSSTGVGITFSSYTKLQYAYDLGAGIKWLPSKNVELSFRYLFSNLGSVYSGTKANLAVDSSYNIPLKTQSLILGLSYLL